MYNALQTRPSFYPWKRRKATDLSITRRWKDRRGRHYHQLMTGEVRRVESDREIRKVLGLSPRQFRKAKRQERAEAKATNRAEAS